MFKRFFSQTAVVASALVTLILLASPLQASAATQHLCMFTNTSECILSNGVGNQLSLDNTDYAAWTITTNVANGAKMFTNGAGHCLTINSSRDAVLASGGCSVSNDNEQFYQATSGGRTTLKNVTWEQYLGGWGNGLGTGIEVRPSQTGFYTGWVYK